MPDCNVTAVALCASSQNPQQRAASWSVSSPSSSSPSAANSTSGGQRRTLVVGGFSEDTRRCDIEVCLRFVTRGWESKIETAFADFKRGSIGFARFFSSEDMWMHIKGRACQPKIQWGEHQLWVGVEKSKVERDAAKRTHNALRIIKPLIHLTADQLSSVDYVEVDYRRCIIWIKQLRLFAWNAAIASWRIRAEELSQLRESGVVAAQVDELKGLLNHPG